MVHNIDIICIQEHRYTHSEDIKCHLLAIDVREPLHLHGKNPINATIGGVGMRIFTSKIRLSLRRNMTRKTTVHYDWSLINNRDIRKKYGLTVRSEVDAIQEKSETHTPKDKYKNFFNAHLEATAECIPTKQKAKSRVLWETLAVRKKLADVKTASKCNRKNPTNINVLKL